MSFEYTVIAAPDRGNRAVDSKSPRDRYAATLALELNRMAADGWEYIRAETLPCEERSGLTGRNTVYHNVLIFRRNKQDDAPLRITADRAPDPTPPVAEPKALQAGPDSAR